VSIADPEYLANLPPPRPDAVTMALCDYAASNLGEDGVVRSRQPNRIADITDGTSLTLMVAEKRLNLAQLGNVQEDDGLGYASGWDDNTVRSTDDPPQQDFYGPAEVDGGQLFGSSHVARMNAVFADGSVRSISYSIQEETFRYLGNKSDGQVLNTEDF
jgi:prepilin-type processing-associated H-X9-DG protein